MFINTDGVVLKSIKYEENDLILILFTRKLGKISVIAKGARRSKSSLLSSSQIFNYANYNITKLGSMYKINQGEIKKSFYSLSSDLTILSNACYICNLVQSTTFENQTNNRLFDLLVKTLYIYSLKSFETEYITRIFELKLLDYIGYRPQILKCVNCETKSLQNPKFSMTEGGVICSNCIDVDIKSIKLDPTTLKLMEYILKNDITICSKAKVSKYILKELKSILNMYMKTHLENVNFKSLSFLENI